MVENTRLCGKIIYLREAKHLFCSVSAKYLFLFIYIYSDHIVLYLDETASICNELYWISWTG